MAAKHLFKGVLTKGLVVLAASALVSCAIDRSIIVGPGERKGATRVIDGKLEVMTDASVASVRMIDGDVILREDSTIERHTKITDGKLIMLPGATVYGDIVAYHADLQLDGAELRGDMELFCTGGSIDSVNIKGRLTVHKKALWHVQCHPSKTLIIGPGSRIGELVVETDKIQVEISDEAEIGKVSKPYLSSAESKS